MTIFKHPTEEGGKSTMNVRRLRTLCVEIYKTLNDLNQIFMNNVLWWKINGREAPDKYKLNLDIPKWNQKTFDSKILKVLCAKIWNNLPYHVKSSANRDIFKNLLRNWDGSSCKCNLCKKWYLLKLLIPIIIYSAYFYFILDAFYLMSYI